ncbi:MAG: DUF4058 family protein [Saprospiraceae bacterium]|nr:DUF4058 family protein [Saprospiraceae bacterium]
MKSPFPGMDPYLEGYLWPDVHHDLAVKIRKQLTGQIRPKYVARLNTYVVRDTNPAADRGIMYPDVEIVSHKSIEIARAPAVLHAGYEVLSGPNPASFKIAHTPSIPVKITVVEIRDTEENSLVTAIEILSPVNKRKPGLKTYRAKRDKLYSAGVHLLEIDLLRRGERPPQDPRLEGTDYVVALTRAEAGETEIWQVGLRSKLPVVPVPLLAPDKDVVVDLQKALDEVYEDAAYELSIDYSKEPPPPKFSEADAAWGKSLR